MGAKWPKKWSGSRSLTLEEIRALERSARLEVQSGDPESEVAKAVARNEARLRKGLARPVKRQVGLRMDEDVIAWLKKDGPGWQTRVNRMLRERMVAELGSAKG